MKKNSLDKKFVFGIAFFVMLFSLVLPAQALDNVISSIVVSQRNDDEGYNLVVNSDSTAQYKQIKENSDSVFFDIKNSTLSPDIGTIYDNVSDIESVTVRQIGKNKVRIYIEGKNAEKTSLFFSPKNTPITKEEIILHNSIKNYEEKYNSENSLNDNSISSALIQTFKEFKKSDYSIFLALIILIGIIISAARNIISKISVEQSSMTNIMDKISNREYIPDIKADFKVSTKDFTQRAATILKAQQELQKTQIKFSSYFNENSDSTVKNKRNYTSEVIKQNFTTTTLHGSKNKTIEPSSKTQQRSGRKDLTQELKILSLKRK